jgi:hypothetical protein
MNYGPTGAYDMPTNNGINTSGGDYHHQIHNHYQPQTKPYTNGFHSSPKSNVTNRLDDTEDEQPQQIDDDYEIDDVDRPKLLMWGLTKYRILINFLYFLYISSIVEVVKRR